LRFYLTPQWHKLADPAVWIAAASQIFYSVGVGWGTLVAFASYNDASHNFVRDAWWAPMSKAASRPIGPTSRGGIQAADWPRMAETLGLHWP